MKKRYLIRQLKLILCFGLSLTLALSSGSIFLTHAYGQSPGVSQYSSSQELLERGLELYHRAQFSEAIAIWQQALDNYRVRGNRIEMARALNFLSLAYQKIGNWEKANAAVEESIDLLTLLREQQNNRISSQELLILAQAFNAKGHLQLAIGHPQEALNAWERATDTYQVIGDSEGEFGSLINQAKALNAMGFNREAVKILLEIETETLQEENPEFKMKTLLALGEALRAIGDLEKSETILLQSLEIAWEYELDIATIYLSLGNTTRLLGEVAAYLDNGEMAKEKRQTALEFYEQAAETGTRMVQLQANLNRLRLLVKMENWSATRQLARDIWPVLHDLPISQSSIAAKINFAESVAQIPPLTPPFQRGGIADAEIVNLLETAIAHARTLEATQTEVYALGALGHWYEVTGQRSPAEDYTEQALKRARKLNVPEAIYRWEWQLARLQKQQGNRKQAIVAYQRAVDAIEQIPQNLADIHKNLSASNFGGAIESDLQFYFNQQVEPLYRQFVDLLLQDQQPSQEISQENLQQARKVIQQLQRAQLEQLLQCSLPDGSPQNLDDLVDQSEPREAIIYPIVLDDRIEVIVKIDGRSELLHHAEAIEAEKVKETLKDLHEKIRQGKLKSFQAKKFSQPLYQWLIQLFKRDLEANNINTLVFVLDANWQSIPMSVLYDGEKYLIEDYAVVITPPGLELPTPEEIERKTLKALLGGMTEFAKVPGLPIVREQFDAIQAQIPSEVLLDREFNRAAIQEKIDFAPFPVVHFATHGQFGSRSKDTHIVTSDGERLDINDLSDVLQSRQETQAEAIELLVFSACQTAKGDRRSGLGLAGVALKSGARSTLATLWNARADGSSVELFQRFYNLLQQDPKVSKAEALRQAQLFLLEDEEWQYPSVWAAYVLVGNWL
jgi:CHAT domain-containing protein